MKFTDFNIPLTIGTDRRSDLIHIQWFVVIASSYLLLVRDGQFIDDSLSLVMLVGPLASMLVFLRLPQSFFAHRYFPQVIAVVDTLLLSTAIVLNRESPWDLCLVFFFGILIAAIGENFLQIIVGCLVAGILSVVIIPASRGGQFALDGNSLLRIPLLFGAALLYGYLADQVKRERRRAAESEESRKQQLSMKDQLLSNVSHELRTPLTAVYQFVTLLLDGIPGKLNVEQKEYLEIALRNVKQLQTMVRDLLDTARVDSGKLVFHLRGVSLCRVVHETIGSFLTDARARSIALTEDIPNDLPFLHADPHRLNQILTNLIDNAIKFTPENGGITVRARVCEEDDSFVRVSVQDTGCGISPDHAEKIFDRLYQEERALATNRKGLGLGLHITKELVSRHGGRIWVESEPNKGSAFHFTLPVFSLKRSLRSLLESAQLPVTSLSIVAAELQPAPGTPPDVAKALQDMVWVSLNQVELAEQTVLLPNIMPSIGHVCFYLAQAKDLESGQALAARVGKEISDCKQVRNANCRVRTQVWTLDLHPATETVNVETRIGEVNDWAARTIAQQGYESAQNENDRYALIKVNGSAGGAWAP
jgi:signal transduction histidine kinase